MPPCTRVPVCKESVGRQWHPVWGEHIQSAHRRPLSAHQTVAKIVPVALIARNDGRPVEHDCWVVHKRGLCHHLHEQQRVQHGLMAAVRNHREVGLH